MLIRAVLQRSAARTRISVLLVGRGQAETYAYAGQQCCRDFGLLAPSVLCGGWGMGLRVQYVLGKGLPRGNVHEQQQQLLL